MKWYYIYVVRLMKPLILIESTGREIVRGTNLVAGCSKLLGHAKKMIILVVENMLIRITVLENG